MTKAYDCSSEVARLSLLKQKSANSFWPLHWGGAPVPERGFRYRGIRPPPGTDGAAWLQPGLPHRRARIRIPVADQHAGR
jgi:hypothetical protein